MLQAQFVASSQVIPLLSLVVSPLFYFFSRCSVGSNLVGYRRGRRSRCAHRISTRHILLLSMEAQAKRKRAPRAVGLPRRIRCSLENATSFTSFTSFTNFTNSQPKFFYWTSSLKPSFPTICKFFIRGFRPGRMTS